MSSVANDLALSASGFLFDPRTGSTYSLNRTGTLVLRRLLDGAAPERIVEHLRAVFAIDRQTAARDVEQFLFRLHGLGLTADGTPS